MIKIEPTLASVNNCTGCRACDQICPRKAIKMLPNEEGFIQPNIDMDLCVSCKECSSICPVLNPRYNNKTVDTCFAMWGDDEIRAKTSTSGIFYLAAQKIIQEDGIVYGAAWKEDWNVHHIGIEKEEDLPLLLGSKYLQSDVENTYQEAKLNLNAGRKVLFSGCPCQIAGLYGYLKGREYPNLITIEVLCHGVPSPKAFHKYLKDNFDDKKIQKILFRDKTVYKWSSSANIYFEDSEVYRKSAKKDPFMEAFLSCLILRESCSSCPFSTIPRQADLSVGDFWGISNTDETWNDKAGTALVLINNDKGQNLWDDLRPTFQRFERFPIEAAIGGNPTLKTPFQSNAGRKHFFYSMDVKPFNQLVKDSLNHYYDIGVVGLWYGINYGSILTYYALYNLLKDLGYDPVMLPKPNTLWDEKFNQPDSIAQKFIWKHCNVFVPYNTQEEYLRTNDRCKDFVLGSDVVWNYEICGRDTDQFFFLDWVESGHKKIAYAASFGNKLMGDSEYQEKAKYYLKQFDAISIRESSGVEVAIQECGRDDITHVLDPVFVCNPQIIDQAISESKLDEKLPFIFSYNLKKTLASKKKKMVKMACDYFNAEPRFCGNPNNMKMSQKTYGDEVLQDVDVEDWLYYVRNCSCYIGDSYHALCFSLLFHKPFIIIYGDGPTKYRFYSLLKLVGLEERFFETMDDPEEYLYLLKEEINWDRVDECLRVEREKSYKWLSEALKKDSPIPTGIDYIKDAEKRKVSEYGVQLFEQKCQLEEQKRLIENLINELQTR